LATLAPLRDVFFFTAEHAQNTEGILIYLKKPNSFLLFPTTPAEFELRTRGNFSDQAFIGNRIVGENIL